MAAKIILYTKDNLSVTKKAEDPNLLEDGKFVRAKVEQGQWILYTEYYYNPDTWGPNSSQVLTEGEGVTALNFTPTSLRPVETFGTDGVTLYKHNDYCGQDVATYKDIMCIQIGGVSSMIISGASWKLYTKPYLDGASATRGPGKYANPDEMGFPNDKLKSISKVV